MTDREKLKKIILELSYEKRLVTLASGRQSDFYFDGKQTTLHAEGGFLVGKLFYEAIKDVPGVQAVGGITLGADPIATATSIAALSGRQAAARLHHPQGAEGARHRASGWKGGKTCRPGTKWSSSRTSSPPAVPP